MGSLRSWILNHAAVQLSLLDAAMRRETLCRGKNECQSRWSAVATPEASSALSFLSASPQWPFGLL